MSAIKSLRTKLPGFENKLGSMVVDMANHETGPQVRGWIEVKHANPHDQLAKAAGVDWVAWLHVRTPDSQTYSCPLIPDEHNPHPQKLVRPNDPPHVFRHMIDAENLANAELPGFVAHIKGEWDQIHRNPPRSTDDSQLAGLH